MFQARKCLTITVAMGIRAVQLELGFCPADVYCELRLNSTVSEIRYIVGTAMTRGPASPVRAGPSHNSRLRFALEEFRTVSRQDHLSNLRQFPACRMRLLIKHPYEVESRAGPLFWTGPFLAENKAGEI